MAMFGKLAAGMLVSLALIVLSALVFRSMWGWFMVPFGLPEVGLAHAMGLHLLVGSLTANLRPDDRKWGEVAVAGFIFRFLVWGLGWIIVSLM